MSASIALLEERVRQLNGLPTTAAAALRCVALARDPNAELRDYVQLIEADSGLSGKVLALTNSAWFGLSRHVTTVKDAVALLGASNVRALAMSYCLAGLHNHWKLDPEDSRAYWEASLAKAVVARLVMRKLQPARSDEASTTGLLQDIAVGFCVEIGGPESAEILRNDSVSVQQQLAHERAHLGFHHVEGGRLIAELIKLPEPYLSSVAAHHDRRQLAASLQDESLALAGYVASLFPHDIRQWKTCERLELDELIRRELSAYWPGAAAFVEQVQGHFGQLVRMLSGDAHEAPSLPQLMAQISADSARETEALVQQVYSTTASQTKLVSALDELEAQRDAAEQRASHDPLTGLLNRAGFYKRAETLLARAQTAGSPVALALLDLHRFKTVNDTHGHACGDAVLRAVTQRLANSRRGDELLCRWGGDELVVLWVGLSRSDCAHVVERLHSVVESSPVTWNGLTLHVAFASGFAWLERFSEMSNLDKLIEEADRALYEAKDCVLPAFVAVNSGGRRRTAGRQSSGGARGQGGTLQR